MTAPETKLKFPFTKCSAEVVGRPSGGFALLLVLLLLVLVTFLVIAVFQLVRTETAASASYERGTSTRMLSETALNLVIGQIQEASRRPNEAWISQPGLLRTYDTAGQAAGAYKLYSSPQMTVVGAFDPGEGVDLPASPTAWQNSPNEWVDLNEPVKTTRTQTSGGLTEGFVYPIVDPRAFNPSAPGSSLVEGFSYDPSWISQTTAPQSVPMPVRWLYLLQDGTMAPGEPTGTGDTVRISGMTQANPAIARLAFWTDDESSKVNINTAAGGVVWDTPAGATFPSGASLSSANLTDRPSSWGDQFYEVDFAQFQPSANEFQRYPGHPATTSLMPVLFRSMAEAMGVNPEAATFNEIATIREAVYELSPRITGGDISSMGGRKRGSEALPLADTRLYASHDELLFDINLDADGIRVEHTSLAPSEEARQELIERLRFFLTPVSRSPETTLSNKPRVVAWPIHENNGPDYRSAFDRLIAFCGTNGDRRYYFTRQNPLSTTADWNPRNREIYSYLQSLTGTAIPGFGGNFFDKWQADRDQVLTQIFDYIRSTNLQDSTVARPYADYPQLDAAERDSIRGVVLPIRPAGGPGAGTTGFGRVHTITEVALIMVRENAEGAPGQFRLAIVPEAFSPMAGYTAMAVNLRLDFSNLDTLTVNGVAVPFPSPTHTTFAAHIPGSAAAPVDQAVPGEQSGQSRLGGYTGPGVFFKLSSVPVSEVFTLPTVTTGNQTVTFSAGGQIRFNVYSPAQAIAAGSPQLLQTFDYTLPQVSLPAPKFFGVAANANRQWSIRRDNALGPNPNGMIYGAGDNNPIDTVFSILPNMNAATNIQGDYRMVSASLPSENLSRFFGLSPLTRRAQHSLRYGWGKAPSQSFYGNLVQGMDGYEADPTSGNSLVTTPDVPEGIDGVKMTNGEAGDWDSGPALMGDGALLNKVDEGTSQSAAGKVPYMAYLSTKAVEPTLFSPNRQMPSPVMFGSLPTGVKRNQPWQTLLFRPDEQWLNLPGGGNHPGSTSPPDHLMLDNFWIPVVEPYAMSEPFSTAGKINLNYQMAPFTYIRRDTGLRAALDGVQITAIDPTTPTAGTTLIERLKHNLDGAPGVSIRKSVDATPTLAFFEERFANNEPFISASEICEIPLVPEGVVAPSETNLSSIRSSLGSFWSQQKLTGDNLLERPYAHLYPRVTTKSNTYTVHIRAQRIQVSKEGLRAGEFGEGMGRVTGEFRGSYTIERFLDPGSDSLVKDDGSGGLIPAANETDPDSFLGPYKFRVLSTKQLSL